jgi:hypothetical protein
VIEGHTVPDRRMQHLGIDDREPPELDAVASDAAFPIQAP